MDRPAPGKNRPTVRVIAALLSMVAMITGGATSARAADWQASLAAMPLSPASPPLTRTNAIRILLNGFRSNSTVKAMIVLPGVIDDFHLIHRDAAPLGIKAGHLAEAIEALTHRTSLQVLFRNSRLVLHTASDRRQPEILGAGTPLQTRLEQTHGLPNVLWVDAQWKVVQPLLKRGLKVSLRPDGDSEEAWHFERLNLAAHGLTDWELLEAVALSTGTRLTLQRRAVLFERPSR